MVVIFMSAALVCRLVCCRSWREYSFVLKVGSINSLFQIFDFRREDFASSFSRIARYTPLFTYKIFSPKIKKMKKVISPLKEKIKRVNL